MEGQEQQISMKVWGKDIGDRLRECRVTARLSQAKLGDQTGVSTGTISRLERGVYEPSLSTLCLIAKELGVTLDSLVQEARPGAESLANSPIAQKICLQFLKLNPAEQKLLLAITNVIIQHHHRR